MSRLFSGKQLSLRSWLQPAGAAAAVPAAAAATAALGQNGWRGLGASTGVQKGGGKKQPSIKNFFQRQQPATPSAASAPQAGAATPVAMVNSAPPTAAGAAPAGTAGPSGRAASTVEAAEVQAGPDGQAASTFLHAELAAAAAAEQQQRQAAKAFWQQVQAAQRVPDCEHGEPAVLKRTNKSGPNRGG